MTLIRNIKYLPWLDETESPVSPCVSAEGVCVLWFLRDSPLSPVFHCAALKFWALITGTACALSCLSSLRNCHADQGLGGESKRRRFTGQRAEPLLSAILSIFPFLSVTLGRSLLLNTMLLLIAQGMTETGPRGERSRRKRFQRTAANRRLQLSAAENKSLLMCPFGRKRENYRAPLSSPSLRSVFFSIFM